VCVFTRARMNVLCTRLVLKGGSKQDGSAQEHVGHAIFVKRGFRIVVVMVVKVESRSFSTASL
jgi:hypothetical protein